MKAYTAGIIIWMLLMSTLFGSAILASHMHGENAPIHTHTYTVNGVTHYVDQ